MRTIPLLPVAPRPLGEELLTCWQERVACHYGRTATELELWLDPGAGQSTDGFERRDFDPDAAMISLWAKACRMDECRIAKMARRCFTRPLDWYHIDRRHQAFCRLCLREDEDADRDHYVRCSWSHVEALACSRHRKELADFCGRCFGRAGFRFHCVEGRARLICNACSTIATRVEFGETDPEKMEFLLALCEEISAAVEGAAPSGSPGRDEIACAARLLWFPSQMNGKPFILWLGPIRPSGRNGMPLERCAPLATATLAWRTATLVGVAQLLDLAGARRLLGPPPAFLLNMFAPPDADMSSHRESHCERPDDKRPAETPIALRPDSEYRALAEEILESAEWLSVQSSSGAKRDRALGRLMSQTLNQASRDRAGGPDRARP